MSVRFVCDVCGASAAPADESAAPSGAMIVTGPLPWATVEFESGREDLCQVCIHAFAVWRSDRIAADDLPAGEVPKMAGARSGDPP